MNNRQQVMNNRQQDPLFLFIHGASGSRAKWRKVLPYIDNPYIAIDLPGHGAHCGRPLTTVEAQAAYVQSLLEGAIEGAGKQPSTEVKVPRGEGMGQRIDEEGVAPYGGRCERRAPARVPLAGQPLIVVGHSLGGLIGIELAKRSPLVQALVLVNSHFELPVHSKLLAQLAQGEYPEALFYASYSKQVDDALLAEERAALNDCPPLTAHIDFRACDEYKSGAEVVAKLTIPLLAVYGSDDRLLPPRAREALTAQNESVQTEIVTAAGHYVPLEQPAALARILKTFRHTVPSR
ncbi:alpha/beta fold hydrolase [Numidum massiliense]|uniref:alpha/beta fold hydrolase n=1 Tax=Numidum massiliense TaxID=1522315 RepID=UPI0006D5AEE4|nr:alpha/beta fold hydrolase [Numidum massiliense]